MKQISFLLAALALWTPSNLRAQDAATEERLNKLSGQIEVLLEGQQALKRHVDALAHDVETLREQVGKPTGNYATQEQLRGLAKSLEEVDRKRMDDAEKIHNELLGLRKGLLAPLPNPKRPTSQLPPESKPTSDDKGFEYVIKAGDNLSAIAQAYQEKNIKVSVSQILKANPGLKANNLPVGKKIFIPSPQT